MPIAYDYPWSKLVQELASTQQSYLVFSRNGEDILPDPLERATTLLDANHDLALVGRKRCSEGFQDVAGPLDGAAMVVRRDSICRLAAAGFRPLYNLAELPCALRHAGWRVGSLGRDFNARPSVEGFRRGRELAASRIYDLGLERMLAQGPRRLKVSALWDIEVARREAWPWKQRLGFVGQVLTARAKGEIEKRFRAIWRTSGATCSNLETSTKSDTQVVLFTANRPWYLRRALSALFKYWPQNDPPRLAISQDGNDLATEALVGSMGAELWKFREPVEVPRKAWLRGQSPYFRIAYHYKFALTRAFEDPTVDKVIILEDDIEIGPDFFSFLRMCDRLLLDHPDLLGASAWNDHGQWAECPHSLHRTDCFPGYGWLIHRTHWDYLGPNWPKSHWDEWLRDPSFLQGRQFLRPELSRTVNFGRTGTGSTEFFDKYIAPVKLQESPIDWSEVSTELDYSDYNDKLMDRVASARAVQELPSPLTGDVKFFYEDKDSFNRLADRMGILPGFRPHAPRAAFEGIVILRMGQFECFLVPRAAEVETSPIRSSET